MSEEAIPYTRNIPNAADFPSAQQNDMLQNSNSIYTWWDVDHITFENENNGYHTVIHQGNSDVPMKREFTNQLFSKETTTPSLEDTSLVSLSGDGKSSILTGHKANVNGYQYRGGVIFQWGRVLNSFPRNATKKFSFTFPFEFPENCFSLQLTPTVFSNPNRNPNGNLTLSLFNEKLDKKKNFYISSSADTTGNYNGFYWFAIGN
jgi:hypothetical protein